MEAITHIGNRTACNAAPYGIYRTSSCGLDRARTARVSYASNTSSKQSAASADGFGDRSLTEVESIGWRPVCNSSRAAYFRST